MPIITNKMLYVLSALFVLWFGGPSITCEENISSRVHTIALDSAGSLKFQWAVRSQNTIYIQVAPFSKQTGGWFALGFSDRGDLTNADYCVMWVDYNGKAKIQDAWSDDHGILHVDYQQDCYLVGNDENMLRWKRLLDTCDPQDYDYVIDDGTTHIVWARGGGGPRASASGINVTSTALSDHGMVRAQLIRAEVPQTPPEDARSIEVRSDKVKVPAAETTYWCHVHRLNETLSKKHHVVQFEPVIQKGNEGLVHHMEVFHCEAPVGQSIPLYVGACHAPDRPKETQVCKKVISAWAMGAGPFVYPEEAGLPIGGENFNLHVMLEVHYNNPELRADFVDSSGVRVWVTENLRQLDAAVMELGLEYTDKMAIPPGQKDFTLSGYCVPECTQIGLPKGGIQVFGSQLHTHLVGVKVRTRHIRNGNELPELNADEHYSTHFQEIRRLKRPVNILPGDALITTCDYRTTHKLDVTLGGFAISDEMCVNYIHYYPATKLEVCKSAISDTSLQSYFHYMNKFEIQPTNDSLGINANYHAIQWSPIRSEFLHQLYTSEPLGMQCNQSSGDRFPGDWSNTPIPKISLPLGPPKSQCSNSDYSERMRQLTVGNSSGNSKYAEGTTSLLLLTFIYMYITLNE